MRKITFFLTCVLFMFLISTAQAGSCGKEVTYELLNYFETLTAPLPLQSVNNLWTFYNDSNLLPPHPYLVQYDAYEATGSIIGPIIPAGNTEFGTGDATPTFNGIFVHAGFVSPTGVVFRAPQILRISEIKLFSEMIGGGLSQTPPPPANGFDVTVNCIRHGIKTKIGSFIFSGPPTFVYVYKVDLLLLKGDMIQVLYGNNGDARFDQGNIDIFITGRTLK